MAFGCVCGVELFVEVRKFTTYGNTLSTRPGVSPDSLHFHPHTIMCVACQRLYQFDGDKTEWLAVTSPQRRR